MNSPNQDVTKIAVKLVSLLKPLDSDGRQRAIQGALALLGESFSIPNVNSTGGNGQPNANSSADEGTRNARTFFDRKTPKTKQEELAVAARFREQSQQTDLHKKDDLKKIFNDARRDFDDHNFRRDISNATIKGFFIKGGTAKTGYRLSHYGQSYIDSLPDRNAVKQIPKPRKGRKPKGSKKTSK